MARRRRKKRGGSGGTGDMPATAVPNPATRSKNYTKATIKFTYNGKKRTPDSSARLQGAHRCVLGALPRATIAQWFDAGAQLNVLAIKNAHAVEAWGYIQGFADACGLTPLELLAEEQLPVDVTSDWIDQGDGGVS